jgi:hypothetical protein
MQHIVPADPSVNLDNLAREVRAAHTAVGHAARNVLEHAIIAGEALIKAQDQLEHGQWLPWLKQHCDLSERHAQRYMTLATHRLDLEANPTRVSDLSLRGALRLLKPPSPQRNRATPSKATNISFDALGWWVEATLEQRRHFLSGIGLDPFMAAMPEAWRPKLERRVAESNTGSTPDAISLPPASTVTAADAPGEDGAPEFLVEMARGRDRKRREGKPKEPAVERPVAPRALSADELAELDARKAEIREIQKANLQRKPCEFRKLDRKRKELAIRQKALGVYTLPPFEGDGVRP